MPDLAEHRIRIRYTGGLADENLLPGYDGATSIDGIVRALNIAVHAYMTGEIVTRATALRGARTLLKPARQGSFITDIIVAMEAQPATTGAAVALAAAPFYDFIKVAFKRAIGLLDADPQTSHLRSLYGRAEPPPLRRRPADLDELAENLEGSLKDAHRPVGNGVHLIEIAAPRTELVTFNQASKDWVNTRDEDNLATDYTGNMTRYNSISRNGRAYIDQLQAVVPVRPDGDYNVGNLGFLTWSLHGSTMGTRNKLSLRARTVRSATGRVKRLLLSSSSRAPEEP